MGVYSGVELVNIYALANDDGDVKMIYYSTFPSKTERFFIDYVWRDAALVLLAIAMVGVSACGLATLC